MFGIKKYMRYKLWIGAIRNSDHKSKDQRWEKVARKIDRYSETVRKTDREREWEWEAERSGRKKETDRQTYREKNKRNTQRLTDSANWWKYRNSEFGLWAELFIISKCRQRTKNNFVSFER